MILALATLYLFTQDVQGLPVSGPDEIIGRASSETCNDLHHCRTVSDIFWSCLTTIFACTWISIHPNIPGPDERWFKVRFRRLGLMFGGLLVPELVIVWAWRQWLAARRLAEENEKFGWVHAHGFFAIMGGFMLVDGDQAVEILLPGKLKSLYEAGEIDFPSIPKEEIGDKSKGDLLSKGLVVLQMGWFVLQCVARVREGLAITELELVTLASASLNFVTYGLWWNKPLDVQRSFRVHVKTRGGVRTTAAGDGDGDQIDGDGGGIGNGTDEGAGRNGSEKGDDKRGEKKSKVQYAHARCHAIFLSSAKGLQKFVLSSFKMEPGAKRIPTFYSGELDLSGSGVGLAINIGLVITMIFGGIHCIAWSSPFPSQLEQIVWRISSLVITCIPAYMLLSGGPLMAEDEEHQEHRPHSWIGILLLVGLPTLLYVFARIMLLALAAMTLRALPPGAYQTVRWTISIPHI